MRIKVAGALTALTAFFLIVFGSSALAITCDACSAATNLNTADSIQCGSNCAANSSQTPTQAASNLGDTATAVINVMSIIVGVVALVMLIVGGLRYVASSGNQETVAGAKRTITYALIGIVVATLSQMLVHFVLEKTKTSIK